MFLYRPHILSHDNASTPDLLIKKVVIIELGKGLKKDRPIILITSDRLSTSNDAQYVGTPLVFAPAIGLVSGSYGPVLAPVINLLPVEADLASYPMKHQLFAKVVGRQAWRLEDVLPAWNKLAITSRVDSDDQAQQSFANVPSPAEIIRECFASDEIPKHGCILLSLTPVSVIAAADATLSLTLSNSVSGQDLDLSIRVETLPDTPE